MCEQVIWLILLFLVMNLVLSNLLIAMMSATYERSNPCRPSASERRGDPLKRFKDFYLKANARIWPCLSVRSAPLVQKPDPQSHDVHRLRAAQPPFLWGYNPV